MKDPGSKAKMRFQVEGMDCSSSATKIANAVRRMLGATDVSVAGGIVTVGHDVGGIDRDEIRNRISGLGYRVERRQRPSRRGADAIFDHGRSRNLSK